MTFNPIIVLELDIIWQINKKFVGYYSLKFLTFSFILLVESISCLKACAHLFFINFIYYVERVLFAF
jgi:hypothetical protein